MLHASTSFCQTLGLPENVVTGQKFTVTNGCGNTVKGVRDFLGAARGAALGAFSFRNWISYFESGNAVSIVNAFFNTVSGNNVQLNNVNNSIVKGNGNTLNSTNASSVSGSGNALCGLNGATLGSSNNGIPCPCPS